jgi:hypothetical protein
MVTGDVGKWSLSAGKFVPTAWPAPEGSHRPPGGPATGNAFEQGPTSMGRASGANIQAAARHERILAFRRSAAPIEAWPAGWLITRHRPLATVT